MLQFHDQEGTMLYIQDSELVEYKTGAWNGLKCLPEQPGRLPHELLDKMKLWSVSIWSLGLCFFFCLPFHQALIHIIFS